MGADLLSSLQPNSSSTTGISSSSSAACCRASIQVLRNDAEDKKNVLPAGFSKKLLLHTIRLNVLPEGHFRKTWKGCNSLHEVQLPLGGGAFSNTQPLVHIQVHGGVVDPLGLVVAHVVNTEQRGPGARVGVHVQWRGVSGKSLLPCAINMICLSCSHPSGTLKDLHFTSLLHGLTQAKDETECSARQPLHAGMTQCFVNTI